MMRFVLVAMIAALGAVGAAKALDAMLPAPAASAPHAAVALAAQDASSPAEIAKSADGHFWAWAEVDGHPVEFLVDTGSTAVALTADDARRLGIDPGGLNYSYNVATANGEAHAAEVELASIEVAGVREDNVQAFVIDHGLPTSLLGMSYLGRLSEFSATPSELILKP